MSTLEPLDAIDAVDRAAARADAERRSIVVAMRDIAAPMTEKDESDRPIGPIVAGAAILILFFGVLGGWAAYAPLSSATTAPGIVKIEGNRKAVQHLDGGIVSDIEVADGGKVEAGQVLITLDDTRARSDYNVFAEQYDSLRAQVARLEAESTDAAAIVFPADMLARADDPKVAAAMEGQKRLLAARRAAFQSELESLRKGISEFQEQIKGTQGQIAAKDAQRDSEQKELDSLKPLFQEGIVPRTRILALEREINSFEGDEHALASDAARYSQAIDQSKAKIDETRQDRVSQVVNELRQTQSQVSDISNRMNAAKDVLDRTVIRAPVAGTVFNLAVFTKGAVIGRGETIMEIEPREQQMRIEAAIRVEDVQRVSEGMDAEVRLTSFKQRDMPIITGKVTYVSPDRQTETHTGRPYYRVDVKVDEKALVKNGAPIELYPGMPATVVIATGDRTALEYLVQPLAETMSSAFHEQ